MSNALSIRSRFLRSHPARARTPLLVLALTASTTGAAHASMLLLSSDCSLSGNPLKCHLVGVLNFLYAVAGVLAFLLVVVAALAVMNYRKINKTKGRL